ncbi:MAG: hypothetical protein K0R71_241 [Bacillales bacterium]|jgi:type IV pilus assembly protein PilA|nr:hypothetical protein [Bacillales bacterium]
MKKVLKNKKGFTLVEIIVVLVILAILAGAAIPTMLGFIDDARERALIAEGRAVLVSAQVEATEAFAANAADLQTAVNTGAEQIENRAGVDGDVANFVVTGQRVTGFSYTIDGRVLTFANDQFTVADVE